MFEVRFLDVVTWFVFILGWFVVDQLARRREANNRLSSKLDEALNLVEEIETFAIDFWLAPATDKKAQGLQRRKMIAAIARLERRISTLQRAKPELGLDSEFIAFNKSILDGEGESVKRSPLPPDDPRMDRIANAAKALVGGLGRAT
ncbi:MAG: hypothetical protein OXF89_01130 [Rhodospirillaceae bacterium]|nr:hypothetical protein [Rhodospirillaceae bacterium]